MIFIILIPQTAATSSPAKEDVGEVSKPKTETTFKAFPVKVKSSRSRGLSHELRREQAGRMLAESFISSGSS